MEITLAGDGRPVQRRTLTVVTITESSSVFFNGRTQLMPVLFLLSGEQAVHSSIGDRLREQVYSALSATNTIPIVQKYGAPTGMTASSRCPSLCVWAATSQCWPIS